MAKREWGAKHTCMGCGVKFYDLHRSPITCPKCGNVIETEIVRTNRRRPAAQPKPSPPANDDNIVAGAVDEGANDGDDLVDDIDDDDDDLVDGVDNVEPTRVES